MNNLGLQNLFKNIIATLGRQLGSGLIQLCTLTIIARTFGPSGNGSYTLALLLPTILATFLNLGLAPANIYYLSSNKVSPYIAWVTTLRISILITIFSWFVGSIIIVFKASSLFPNVPKEMLWLSLASFPLIFSNINISSFFQGLQEFKKFNIILLLQPILHLIVVIFLIFIIKLNDLIYILISYIICLAISQIIAYRFLCILLSKKSGPYIKNYYKKLLNYGYKSHLTNILAFLNYRIDLLLLSFFLGPSPVGIYTIAVTISEKLWLVSQAVSTVLLPKLSQLSTDEDKRRELTPLMARLILWITFFAALALALVAFYGIEFVFGEEYKDAYQAILFLLPGIVFGSCSKILANDLAARGRPELNLSTSWVAVIINIIGNILLVPKLGIEGAAIATSFAYIINFILRLFIHNYITGIPFYKNLFFNITDIRKIRSLIKKSI